MAKPVRARGTVTLAYAKTLSVRPAPTEYKTALKRASTVVVPPVRAAQTEAGVRWVVTVRQAVALRNLQRLDREFVQQVSRHSKQLQY